MTQELLEKANDAQKNIDDINLTLASIKRIKIVDNNNDRNHKPMLRFANILKRKNGKDVREATAILFDGLSMYGTEIPFDDRLLKCLRKHYEERLVEAKAVFDGM